MMVSVVVRSYNRLPALCELLDALLLQRHPSFEVVVVEQSRDRPEAAARRLEEIARDPRIRLLRRPPLGGAAARNEGVDAARGEVILFIDDDDLPGGEDWIALHAAAYDDPSCLGVSGQQRYAGEPEHRYSRLLDRMTGTLSFDPVLRLPLCYVRHDRRRIPVGAIHGTNASVRRSAVERFGGWDADTAIEDEASFCIRAQRGMRAGEYFAYDPRPGLVRRRDLAGGLDKRRLSAARYYGRYLDFVHVILGRYHRRRLILLYPLYLLGAWVLALGWIWGESRRHTGQPQRLAAAIGLLVAAPVLAVASLLRVRRPSRRDLS